MVVRYAPRDKFGKIVLAIWLVGLVVYGLLGNRAVLIGMAFAILISLGLAGLLWILDKLPDPRPGHEDSDLRRQTLLVSLFLIVLLLLLARVFAASR